MKRRYRPYFGIEVDGPRAFSSREPVPASLENALAGDAELGGNVDEIRQRARIHLAHDAASMRLDRDLADAERTADLFVQSPGNDQGENFTLAATEGIVAVSQRPQICRSRQGCLAALDCSPDGAQQYFIAKRLG